MALRQFTLIERELRNSIAHREIIIIQNHFLIEEFRTKRSFRTFPSGNRCALMLNHPETVRWATNKTLPDHENRSGFDSVSGRRGRAGPLSPRITERRGKLPFQRPWRRRRNYLFFPIEKKNKRKKSIVSRLELHNLRGDGPRYASDTSVYPSKRTRPFNRHVDGIEGLLVNGRENQDESGKLNYSDYSPEKMNVYTFEFILHISEIHIGV